MHTRFTAGQIPKTQETQTPRHPAQPLKLQCVARATNIMYVSQHSSWPTPMGRGVNLRRHPPTTHLCSLCSIPQTFSVRLGLQVFKHGIVVVRNHHATFACYFHGELSQGTAGTGQHIRHRTQHSISNTQIVQGPDADIPQRGQKTKDPPVTYPYPGGGGGVPAEGGTQLFRKFWLCQRSPWMTCPA